MRRWLESLLRKGQGEAYEKGNSILFLNTVQEDLIIRMGPKSIYWTYRSTDTLDDIDALLY